MELERTYTVTIGEFVLYEVPFLEALSYSETGLRVYMVVEEYLRKEHRHRSVSADPSG